MSSAAASKISSGSTFAPFSKMLALGRLKPFLAESEKAARVGKRHRWPLHVAASVDSPMSILLRAPFMRHQTIVKIKPEVVKIPETIMPLFDEVFKDLAKSEIATAARPRLQKVMDVILGKDKDVLRTKTLNANLCAEEMLQAAVYFSTLLHDPFFDDEERGDILVFLANSFEETFAEGASPDKVCKDIVDIFRLYIDCISSQQQYICFQHFGINTVHIFTQIVEAQEREKKKFLLSQDPSRVMASLHQTSLNVRAEWGVRGENGQPASFPAFDDQTYAEDLRCTFSIPYQVNLVSDLLDTINLKICSKAFDEILLSTIPDEKKRAFRKQHLEPLFFIKRDGGNHPTNRFAVYVLENLGFLARMSRFEARGEGLLKDLDMPPDILKYVPNTRAIRDKSPPASGASMIFPEEHRDAFALAVIFKLMASTKENARMIDLFLPQGPLFSMVVIMLEKVPATIVRLNEISKLIDVSMIVSKEEDQIPEAQTLSRLLETPDSKLKDVIALIGAKDNALRQINNARENLRLFYPNFFDRLSQGRSESPVDLCSPASRPMSPESEGDFRDALILEVNELPKRIAEIVLVLNIENIPEPIVQELKKGLDALFARQRIAQTELTDLLGDIRDRDSGRPSKKNRN